MAPLKRMYEFCPTCGSRQVLSLHGDGTVHKADTNCGCVPGPYNPPRSYEPGKVLMIDRRGNVNYKLEDEAPPTWVGQAGNIVAGVMLVLMALFFIAKIFNL